MTDAKAVRAVREAVLAAGGTLVVDADDGSMTVSPPPFRDRAVLETIRALGGMRATYERSEAAGGGGTEKKVYRVERAVPQPTLLTWTLAALIIVLVLCLMPRVGPLGQDYASGPWPSARAWVVG